MNKLSPDSSKEIIIIDNEAQIISKYLVGSSVDEKEETLYKRAIIEKKIFLSGRDERLWRLMLRSKLLLPAIDSGLALISPNCSIRERICIMLAILETHPSFVNSFLIKKTTIKESLQLVWFMAIAPLRAIIGIAIIKLY